MATKPKPGRPAGVRNSDTQDRIVRSACELFARNGIGGTSNQQLAKKARVTPAMIHYYFKRREDLYKAVMEYSFGFAREQLLQAGSLEEWVHTFHDNLTRHPWKPHLIIREVIPHGGQLQAYFLKHVGPAIFGSIRTQMVDTAKTNNLGKDFDIERHVILLMGMLVYPFIGREIAEKITGKTFNETMMINFREDALALFEAGIKARTLSGTKGARP